MNSVTELAMSFVDIASPSRSEGELARVVESLLSACDHLETIRIGDNVVAFTQLGRAERVIVAGHLHTVPLEHGPAEEKNGVISGLGIVDMKGTLAVMTHLAQTLTNPGRDITWIFYAREEIARSESGLHEIAQHDASLLLGDVAILGEPTSGLVEAGCQGTLHAQITLGGKEAHSARPYMGVNAIHRASDILQAIATAPVREVPIDGVIFSEQLQAVTIEGGRALNVVPGSVTIAVNHRFAPDRSGEDAARWLESILAPYLDPEHGDSIVITESAPGALPNLTHPILGRLVELSGGEVSAKVGWTDVATFTERGVPAANFGAGDPHLANRSGECLTAGDLESLAGVLQAMLNEGS